jgi:predicted Zn-dependent protease
MLAFGYEQCHLLDQAERAARRALELKRKEPWAQHALAHVMLTQGRTDEGTEFLAEISDTWDGLSSFMYTHIWWHQCLFLLDRAAYEEVLEIYDQHLWGIDKTYSQDQVGAVSTLLRLELHGVDVGDRWQDVADYLTGRLDDHVQPFLDLHYVYGLARAGRAEADQLLNSMDDFAKSAHEDVRKRWTDVALPAARGLVAHAQGRHEDASQMLGPTIAAMAQIGGSHAQRELFELVLLDAQIRCGDLVPAQQKLELMRGRDERAPHVWRQLERVYQGLELPQQAAQARRHLESLG